VTICLVAARIQYARSGDVHIAYATIGDGPRDVVFVPGFVSSVDYTLEDLDVGVGAIIDRLSKFARITTFDKRGTGLSDRSVGVAGLEERMDDARTTVNASTRCGDRVESSGTCSRPAN
jgi:pimeloyl-ACP methyl ester carboxylesterase